MMKVRINLNGEDLSVLFEITDGQREGEGEILDVIEVEGKSEGWVDCWNHDIAAEIEKVLDLE